LRLRAVGKLLTTFSIETLEAYPVKPRQNAQTRPNRAMFQALLADIIDETSAPGAQRAFRALRCVNGLKLAKFHAKSGSSMRKCCAVCGERLGLWERVWGRFDHARCRAIVLARYAEHSLAFQKTPFASAVATSGGEPGNPFSPAPTPPNAERAQAPAM
jgi:hypothetical protein